MSIVRGPLGDILRGPLGDLAGDTGCCCESTCECCLEGAISVGVEWLISPAPTDGSFGCACVDFNSWHPVFGSDCFWVGGATCTEGILTYGTIAGATLHLRKATTDCNGNATPSENCHLTLILTGNSAVSGGGGEWIVVYELDLGVGPLACRDIWELPYKCGVSGSTLPCDFSITTAFVNIGS